MVGDATWQSGNVTSQLSSEIIQTSSGVLKANLVISANRGDALTNRYIIYGDNSVDHEFKTKTAASLLKLHNSGLVEIADGLEQRTTRKLNLAVRLLEPLLLMVLAGAVLFVVVALLMPVIKMSSTIG